MRAVINGLRYDTEKAECVGSARSGHNYGDLHFWRESLYRTPRAKRFFLAGAGGALSAYSRACGQNQWSGGAAIRPLTDTEARAWTEQYCDAETVARFFAVEDA